MKLFEKIKNLFLDEIEDEDELELIDEEKEEYKEPPKDVLPKVMRDTIEKEEKVKLPPSFFEEEKIKPSVKEVKKEEIQEPVKKFSFPLDFENELPSRSNNVNVLKIEKEQKEREQRERELQTKKASELYPKKEPVKQKPKFKATPVISPVYGILDKNYKKDEVKEKTEETTIMKRPSKKVDFETVRKKAFGNLVDDLKDNMMCENCELYKEVKKISALKEDDLLYDMTVDEDTSGDVTIEKAYENYSEFGVAYEPKINNSEENKEVIAEEIVIKDVLNEDNVETLNNDVKEEAVEVILEDKTNEELEKEIEEVVEKVPSRQSKKKETKVDEDFFELIDSMYKERIDG